MIYLMRHADAVANDVDAVRALSPKGREQVAKVCAALSKVPSFRPVEIWHSPLLRSKETASLLAEGLGLSAPQLLKPGLEPDDDPGIIAAVLRDEQRDIAIVGHEPHLGVLSSMMVHGPKPGTIFFPFPKAGVLALARREKGWRSEWLVRAP
jgi:phosphohistidine phosphatase